MTSRIGWRLACIAAAVQWLWIPAATPAQAPALPNPVLVVTGLKYIHSDGAEWTRYFFRVENLADFPNELFTPSPELPPCGTNTKAARSWVDMYDSTGKRLYGFCALPNQDALGELWFTIPTDSAPPKSVYIEFVDRKTGKKVKSNLTPTTRGRRVP